MKKVHIVKINIGNGVQAVYSHHSKAVRVVEKANKGRSWIDRMKGAKWIVQSFGVIEGE